MANSNGCLSLTAVCPPSPSGGASFMRFNNNIGGPITPIVGEVTADFSCVNGTWKFTQSGVTLPINEVNCLAA